MKTKQLVPGFLFAFFAIVPASHAAVAINGESLANGIISTVIYSILGILMAAFSYKVIDLLTPGKLSRDIADNNIALAILTGLMMLGVCIIIAAVLAS
jgi:uncharacterized membrane protein YjfL (UPF0719 family)